MSGGLESERPRALAAATEAESAMLASTSSAALRRGVEGALLRRRNVGNMRLPCWRRLEALRPIAPMRLRLDW
eukprot:1037446-Pleurochrysis_carterae.AAC.1